MDPMSIFSFLLFTYLLCLVVVSKGYIVVLGVGLGKVVLTWYNIYLPSTHLLKIPFIELKLNLLLPHHILDTYHNLLPQPYTYPQPCLLIHIPNLQWHHGSHVNLLLSPLHLLTMLGSCVKRLYCGAWGGIREGVGVVSVTAWSWQGFLFLGSWFLCHFL